MYDLYLVALFIFGWLVILMFLVGIYIVTSMAYEKYSKNKYNYYDKYLKTPYKDYYDFEDHDNWG